MNRVGFTIASSPGSNREHERIPWYLPKPAPNDLPKRDQPVADHTGQFLSPRFFDRVGTSLLLSDPQPKNVIVVNSDAIVLVDIDYRIGNPALGLAQFICGLDSMRLRHPSALSARAVADWQVQFLAAYFERSRPFHADD